MLNFPFSLSNSPEVIRQRRQSILDDLRKSDSGFAATPVTSIRRVTLQRMLKLYDIIFFAGTLQKYYKKLEVTMSARLLKSAGKFIHYTAGPSVREAEIRMSSDFLFRLREGPFELNGLVADTPQEAFLIVFEHELCHAVENALYGSTSHSSRFMGLAHGVFGHTKATHELPTRSSETAEKTGIVVGSRVSFPYEGRMLTGIVSYIGKTARVMVPSQNGIYTMNNNPYQHYSKYQVPLHLLKKQ